MVTHLVNLDYVTRHQSISGVGKAQDTISSLKRDLRVKESHKLKTNGRLEDPTELSSRVPHHQSRAPFLEEGT